MLTLASAAAAPTLLLAPDGEKAQNTSQSEDDAIDELKRRYASGEIPEAEFERRLETLMKTPSKEGWELSDSGSGRGETSAGIESELN